MPSSYALSIASAEKSYRAATFADPTFASAFYNLGLLLELHRGGGAEVVEEAEACYRRTLQLEPANANALSNLGALLKDAHQR